MIIPIVKLVMPDGEEFNLDIEEFKIERQWANKTQKMCDYEITLKGEVELPNPFYEPPAPKEPKKPKKTAPLLIDDEPTPWMKDEEDEEI